MTIYTDAYEEFKKILGRMLKLKEISKEQYNESVEHRKLVTYAEANRVLDRYFGTPSKKDSLTLIDTSSDLSNKTSWKMKDITDSIDFDKLWEKMYTKMKDIWFPCPACNSANALGNSNCVSCGIGLGDFYKKPEEKNANI